MVYELSEDGSGSVIAEAKQADAPPYLGLRYPATDITVQANTEDYVNYELFRLWICNGAMND